MKGVILSAVLVLALAGAAGAKSHAPAHKTAPAHATSAAARSEIVVGRGWPIHRALPTVVVRPSHAPVRVAPATYLAPVIWHPLVVPRPAPEQLVWQEGDHLSRAEDWTEMTFNTVKRGSRLFLEAASGRVQAQF